MLFPDARKLLLVVEDERAIAELERNALEESGFRVQAVSQGQRALEQLALGDQIALMVLDYRLPDMTGADVVAALGDRIAFLPVVVVTGCPDPDIERQLRDAGVMDYIVKDIGMRFLDRLPQVVHAALN